MAEPVFGISIRRVDEEARPVVAADLSTIGIIGPSDDADEDVFPLNEPIRVDSNRTSILTKLGNDGYLADAVRGINDQLGETQFAARIVIVRTARGAAEDPALKLQQTINNIVGSSLAGTGLWAFLRSADKYGFTPRLLTAPGFTSQRANWVGTVTQNTDGEGSGYTEGKTYNLTFSGGGDGTDNPVIHATAHAVGKADGSLGPAIFDFQGAWYTANPTVTADPPDDPGTTATYTAHMVNGANPVCASLTGVLNQLIGHAVVESSGVSQDEDDDWRETMQSERLIAVSGGVRVQDPETSNIVMRPLAPRVLGIAVRRDFEKGAPFHSWANQPVQGIIGPSRDIPFVLTDGAVEAQELLAHNIGVVVRGQVGNDFAIASGGFVFIGTDNLGEDELWRFYNVTRGRDFIHLTLIKALRYYLGRYNITPHTVQAIIDSVKNTLRDLRSDGHILDYRATFRTEGNSADKIRQGRLQVGFKAEEPPVLRHITVESARYRQAIDAMVSELAAQLNLTT